MTYYGDDGPGLCRQIQVPLKNIEVAQQNQHGDNNQDDQASLEYIFQDMLPKKADDHQRNNDYYNNHPNPDHLTGWDGWQVKIH